ncbi:DUF1501 domain-containing protein [Parvularcula maris]|uniref:DUF1501 domain-containing protein n=1 Tax=Parvularcula maris TaxID=2965077 RepID=A0A9X2LA65_9PROT|nr:DUF1501 domain-containing protein [Parvularcula maris]MCQ8184852.1 DUF1501 domain-containing protein [Parvularcula maris]
MTDFSRRSFLKTSALGLTASAFMPLPVLAQGGGGYKALVCIFLYGGADTHDVLIGQDEGSYQAWAAARESIVGRYGEGELPTSRERSALLALPGTAGQPTVGLPPEMSAVKELFDQGQLAFAANVGPLAEVTDRAGVKNKTALLPNKLRSHNDQQSVWQTFGTEGARIGWGGRLLDRSGTNSAYAAISTRGNAVFLSGDDVRPTQIPSNGNIKQAWGTGEKHFGSEELASIMRAHYARTADGSQSPFMRDIARSRAKAVATTAELARLMEGATLGDTVRIEGNGLSQQLGTIADLIQLRGDLGTDRQVFFAGMGGWDTHREQHLKMPVLLNQLSEAMASFQRGLDAAGLSQMVTTFTASDFGRTLINNSAGTDHGWGSHHMVMGGGVSGGQIAGTVPSFEEEHDHDFRRGALIPTMATEQYGAELGRWFGLSEGDLDLVFANRGRFDRTPLGLLA